MKTVPLKRKIAAMLVLVLAGMQLVRCDHTNPPVTAEIQASPEVKSILRRACYDCHSNESGPGTARWRRSRGWWRATCAMVAGT